MCVCERQRSIAASQASRDLRVANEDADVSVSNPNQHQSVNELVSRILGLSDALYFRGRMDGAIVRLLAHDIMRAVGREH